MKERLYFSIGKILVKKYAKELLYESDIVLKIFQRYIDYNIICICIGGNQFDLAKVISIAIYIYEKMNIKVPIFTDFFRSMFLSEQINRTQFIHKIGNANKNLLITTGSNIRASEKYMEMLKLEKVEYKILALDYEIINMLNDNK